MENNLYAQMSKRWSMLVEMPFTVEREPGKPEKISLPMVVLSARELVDARQKAEQDARAQFGKDVPKKDEASTFDFICESHLAAHTVALSVRMPDDEKKKFFPSKQAVVDSLTSEQIAIIANDYMTVQLNQPFIVHLDNDDPEKIEKLMQSLIDSGTNDTNFFLNSLTSHSAIVLINSLTAKLKKLLSLNTSATEPQESGTTEELTPTSISEEPT